MLLVYEGLDDSLNDECYANIMETVNNKPPANCCHYDADISNCSTDLNLSSSHESHDDSHQFSSSDDHDIGIGNDDESNMEENINHCLYDDNCATAPAKCNTKRVKDVASAVVPNHKGKFLEMPANRAVSPHSMDSWICYSNSSDEYSTQDYIVNKGTKLNLHDNDDDSVHDDVDVYDKINFVNNMSVASKKPLSSKKSKIDSFGKGRGKKSIVNEVLKVQQQQHNFKFPADIATITSPPPPPPTTIVLQKESVIHVCTNSTEVDDGIEVEVEGLGDVEDDQLSSLSSNIDTIIVSDNGETKFFDSAEADQEYPISKKNRLSLTSSPATSSAATTTITSTMTAATTTSTDTFSGNKRSMLMINNNNASSTKPNSLVDVRIIDFAHTTFAVNTKNALEVCSYSTPESLANRKLHHGPDGGFLTGITSLKRILSEIIIEPI